MVLLFFISLIAKQRDFNDELLMFSKTSVLEGNVILCSADNFGNGEVALVDIFLLSTDCKNFEALLLANHIEFTKYTERSSSYGIIWGS
jgi:hypothetical protein